MKTLGRILIILAAFTLVMGVTYGIVSARSSSIQGAGPGLDTGNGRFVPQNGAPPGFANGARPEFPGRERDGFRGGRGAASLFFGAIRNILILGLIVAVVVLPKSWMQKKKRAARIAPG